VDYGVEATELVGLVGNGLRPGYGGEIPGDDPPSTGCRREGVAAATVISSVQNDIMALLDQEPGGHQTQAVR